MLIFNSKAAVKRRGFRPKISDDSDDRQFHKRRRGRKLKTQYSIIAICDRSWLIESVSHRCETFRHEIRSQMPEITA